MTRTTSESMIRRRLEVTLYENTNAEINRLMDDDDTIYICQGPYGRVPILADTVEEASDRYIAKYLHRAEEEEEEAVTEDEG